MTHGQSHPSLLRDPQIKTLKVEASKDLRAGRSLKTSEKLDFSNLWVYLSAPSLSDSIGEDCHKDFGESQSLASPVSPQLLEI